MAIVHARYLTGSSIQLTKCESIGQIMIHFANLHNRFAQEVAVTCPDTGQDLTNPPSQIPPSVVQVVIKPEEEKITDENLLLAVRLHGQYRDAATCLRAYKTLKERHSEDEDEIPELLAGAIGKPYSTAIDIKTQKTIVETLLHASINLNYFLYEAAENKDDDRVKMLLSAGVPVEGNVDEYENAEGYQCTLQTPLSIAAYGGYLETVKILLEHKADANRLSELHPRHGCELGRPLMFASAQNRADVARELLTHKALVNLSISSTTRKTPLYMALRYESEQVVEVLLANGASVVDHNVYSFAEACKNNRSTKSIKMLIDHGGSFPRERIDMLLVEARSPDMVKTLVDFHLSDILEKALHDAARTCWLEKVNVLLDVKADINRATISGTNILHKASMEGRLSIVKLLLARKANVNKEDNSNGKTALAYALDNNHRSVADLLQEHGAILPDESHNDILACKRKRKSEDNSAASECKRQKSTEDETSEKKTCSSGNNVLEEKEQQNHSSTSEDRKNKQISSEGCGSCASRSEDLKTLGEECVGYVP